MQGRVAALPPGLSCEPAEPRTTAGWSGETQMPSGDPNRTRSRGLRLRRVILACLGHLTLAGVPARELFVAAHRQQHRVTADTDG
jgi:3-deoxy-D-arabino-heptulosonate 7-phosphate (DAHP) synthase